MGRTVALLTKLNNVLLPLKINVYCTMTKIDRAILSKIHVPVNGLPEQRKKFSIAAFKLQLDLL